MKTHFSYFKPLNGLTLNKTRRFNLCSMMCWLILVFGMSNFVKAQETGTFTDERDGREYKTVVLNGQTWMAENLAYESGSYSWEIDKTMLGCWYACKVSNKVCPKGWHLPTKKEWVDALDATYNSLTSSYHYGSLRAKNMDNKGFPYIYFSEDKRFYYNKSGFKHKAEYLSKFGLHYNKKGLNIIPSSFYIISENKYETPYQDLGLGSGAAFWTSSTSEKTHNYVDVIKIDHEYGKIVLVDEDPETDNAHTIRCVKD